MSENELFELVDLHFPRDADHVVAEFVTDPVLAETKPVRLHVEVSHVGDHLTLDQVTDIAWHTLSALLRRWADAAEGQASVDS